MMIYVVEIMTVPDPGMPVWCYEDCCAETETHYYCYVDRAEQADTDEVERLIAYAMEGMAQYLHSNYDPHEPREITAGAVYGCPPLTLHGRSEEVPDLAEVIGCFEGGSCGDPLLEFEPGDEGLSLRWGGR